MSLILRLLRNTFSAKGAGGPPVADPSSRRAGPGATKRRSDANSALRPQSARPAMHAHSRQLSSHAYFYRVKVRRRPVSSAQIGRRSQRSEPASDIAPVLDPGGRLEKRTSAAASKGPTRMTCITELPRARLARSPKVHQPAVHQAVALFLIAPMIAVSMAPPAPPAKADIGEGATDVRFTPGSGH